jgi:phospholipid/cholesterol/gamma-HCH transport system substrate-binding protein
MVLVYTKGAQELHDSVKTLEAMASRPATPQQQEELREAQRRVQMVTEQLSDLSTRMAEGLKRQSGNSRGERTLR